MNIKACIFDLDGVICDTAKYHYMAWKELADELGFEFTLEHNERLKGISRMKSLDILLDIGKVTVGQSEKVLMADRKNERYRSNVLNMHPNEILPGVKPFLMELRKEGVKIALGSASKNARTILERLEITHLFDAIVDGTMVKNAKPDPEVFLLGASLLKVEPKYCVVFEDAMAGIEAAINGTMKSVGVGKKDVLQKADYVIEGFENISLSVLRKILEPLR